MWFQVTWLKILRLTVRKLNYLQWRQRPPPPHPFFFFFPVWERMESAILGTKFPTEENPLAARINSFGRIHPPSKKDLGYMWSLGVVLSSKAERMSLVQGVSQHQAVSGNTVHKLLHRAASLESDTFCDTSRSLGRFSYCVKEVIIFYSGLHCSL